MSQDAARPYSTELRKGRGAVAETLTLLGAWVPGMPSTELQTLAVEQGIFGSSSAKRAQDLVSVVFARRYLVDGGKPASYLKYLVERGADRAVLRQLMLVYTARRNPVPRDFISEVFWAAFAAGAAALSIGEAEDFLRRAAVDGRIARPWSEVMHKRIAGDLLSTLADFGLLEDLKRPTKPIRSYRLLPDTVLFLAHEIHFKGFSDNSILCHKHFDVVVMNPPFGAASTGAKTYITKTYPRSKNDLLAACVERGIGWLQPGGLLGAITSRTAFFLTSFRNWRQGVVLGDAKPVVMADLGHGVMDAAMVDAAAYVLKKH